MVAQMPKTEAVDAAFLDAFEIAKGIVSNVRTIRLQKNIPNKQQLTLQALGAHDAQFNAVIMKSKHH